MPNDNNQFYRENKKTFAYGLGIILLSYGCAYIAKEHGQQIYNISSKTISKLEQIMQK